MQKVEINVLGTPYIAKFGDRKAIGISEEHMGACRIYAREILVDMDKEDCNKEELKVRTREILAHEIFHAFVNEAGIDLDPSVEEQMASFYMKNWEKMSNTLYNTMRTLPESLFDK